MEEFLNGVLYFKVDPQEMKDYGVSSFRTITKTFMVWKKRVDFLKPTSKTERIFFVNDSGFVYAAKDTDRKNDTDTFATYQSLLPNIPIWTCVYYGDSMYIDSPYVYLYDMSDRKSIGKYDLMGKLLRYYNDIYYYTNNRLDSIVYGSSSVQFTYYVDGSICDIFEITKGKNDTYLSSVVSYTYGDKGLPYSIRLIFPHNPNLWYETIFDWSYD